MNATTDTAGKAGAAGKGATDKGADAGNTAVPHQGDHDRVQMLSLRADGTPDQHNPEMIGDRDTTLAATKEQFVQQAVSAADVQRNAAGPVTLVGQEDGSVKEIPASEAPQDPSVAAAQAEHQKVADAAAKAAEAAVDALHRDSDDTKSKG